LFLYLCICVKRRHYFVVVCQLTGASVSKLPRAPQLSHRKSDCRLSTLRQHHYLSAYGTAHKIGVEPILLRFIARPTVCAIRYRLYCFAVRVPYAPRGRIIERLSFFLCLRLSVTRVC
jgi:hypothetical protein